MPTKQNFTGQYLDDTGLLYYNARYYDPNTARFISADTVVPGNASGGMDGIALKPLTVSFSEPGFLSKANQENQFGPWFTLSSEQKQQLGSPMGPTNPQALNRYAYVLNNPVRYIDPSGHAVKGGNDRVGYETVCANAAGQQGACGGAYKEVSNADGTAHLMRIHSTDENGNVIVKYVWSSSQKYKDFKDYVDEMDDAYENAAFAAVAAMAGTIGAIVSCPTVAGCVVGGGISLVGWGAYYAYLFIAADNLEKAREEFDGITDARQGPPAPSKSSRLPSSNAS